MAEHLSITQTGPHLTVTLAGNWKLDSQPPARDVIIAKLRTASDVKSVSISDGGIYGWDTGLMLGLKAVSDWCEEAGCTCTIESLPDGADRLWKLALAVPERAGARRGVASRSYLHRLGERALAVSAVYWL